MLVRLPYIYFFLHLWCCVEEKERGTGTMDSRRTVVGTVHEQKFVECKTLLKIGKVSSGQSVTERNVFGGNDGESGALFRRTRLSPDDMENHIRKGSLR